MILNKMIYDVREVLRQYTDDSEVSDRYIIYLYGLKRAKYLRQDLNNYQRTTDISVTQTLCLPLEQISANQCGLNIDCETILRTTKPIPQPLELHIKSAITSVKPSKKLVIPFSFVNKEKATYFEDSPFNGIFAYLDNDKYIYLVSKINTLNLLDCITITGVFEDPLDLLNYSNCCNCEDIIPCYNIDTSNYPLQPHLIDLIKLEIINELIKESNIPEDKKNDSNDKE
jgi:hypothetical protein